MLGIFSVECVSIIEKPQPNTSHIFCFWQNLVKRIKVWLNVPFSWAKKFFRFELWKNGDTCSSSLKMKTEKNMKIIAQNTSKLIFEVNFAK